MVALISTRHRCITCTHLSKASGLKWELAHWSYNHFARYHSHHAVYLDQYQNGITPKKFDNLLFLVYNVYGPRAVDIEAASGLGDVDTKAAGGPRNNELNLFLVSVLKGPICPSTPLRQTLAGRLWIRSRLVEDVSEKVAGSDASSGSKEDIGSLVQYVGTVLAVDRHFGRGYKNGISKARVSYWHGCCFDSSGRSANQGQGKLVSIWVNILEWPHWPLLIVALKA